MMSNTMLAWWVFLFVLSGVALPLLVTQARYVYAPPPQTLWPLYPLYLGNLFAGMFSKRLPVEKWCAGTRLFFLDLAGQIFTNLGLLVVGPLLFSILFRSVTVFTGVLSVFCLPAKSHPTRQQWFAMLLITAGLSVGGVEAFEKFDMRHLLGAGLVLLGCACFAGGAVASEFFLGAKGGMGPMQAAWVIGVQGSILCSVWATATVRFHGELYGPGFWVLMLAMVVMNTAHQAAWFTLVGHVGACATAVLKAAQSALVFMGAGAVFCVWDQEECMTRDKVLSFLIVTMGVIAYSFPVPSMQESKIPFGLKGVDETTPILHGGVHKATIGCNAEVLHKATSGDYIGPS